MKIKIECIVCRAQVCDATLSVGAIIDFDRMERTGPGWWQPPIFTHFLQPSVEWSILTAFEEIFVTNTCAFEYPDTLKVSPFNWLMQTVSSIMWHFSNHPIIVQHLWILIDIRTHGTLSDRTTGRRWLWCDLSDFEALPETAQLKYSWSVQIVIFG